MNKAPVIMAVDHEPRVLRLIRHELSARGYRVLVAHKGAEALKTAAAERPDIMLVDIATSDLPGLEIVRRLRKRTSAPIIVLGEGSERERQHGLATGANDYLGKPFDGTQLNDRVRRALQLVPGRWADSAPLRIGDVTIDLDRRVVTKGDGIVLLTRTEWLILQHLATQPGRTVPGAELAAAVWGDAAFGAVPHLRIWISRLRRKLEDDPSHPKRILTVRRGGYMLAASSAGHGDAA